MDKADQILVESIIRNIKDGIGCQKEFVGEVLSHCSEMELNGVIPTIQKATGIKPAQLRKCMKDFLKSGQESAESAT